MTADRPVPLDEYPVHQVPLSMKHVVDAATATPTTAASSTSSTTPAAPLLILGLGVYPNPGVIDAYATLRLGDDLHAVRASDALGDDRMNLSVGPLRIIVDAPLQRLTPALRRRPRRPGRALVRHHLDRRVPGRSGSRTTSSAAATGSCLEGRRFVQAGTATGSIRVEGEELTLTPGEWTGTRDRSWGVRPDRPVRTAAGPPRSIRPEGFHWLWMPGPLRGPLPHGRSPRRTPTATAPSTRPSWSARGHGRDAPTRLAPAPRSRYRPGTRHPERAVVHLTDPARKPLELERGDPHLLPARRSAPATRPPTTGSTAPGRAAAGPTAASTTSPTRPPTPWPPSASPTTRPASPSTAGSATASSSTAASAATTRAASPATRLRWLRRRQPPATRELTHMATAPRPRTTTRDPEELGPPPHRLARHPAPRRQGRRRRGPRPPTACPARPCSSTSNTPTPPRPRPARCGSPPTRPRTPSSRSTTWPASTAR